MIAYVDSSALVKLVLEEAESAALDVELSRYERIATSDLTFVEVSRAVRRVHGDAGGQIAMDIFRTLDLLRIDEAVVSRAAGLLPAGLRTLDALHVASAVELGVPVVVIAYDQRLLEAAEAAGLSVAAPR